MGNVSKKGKNMKVIITWSVFASRFLTELCLYMNDVLKDIGEIYFFPLKKDKLLISPRVVFSYENMSSWVLAVEKCHRIYDLFLDKRVKLKKEGKSNNLTCGSFTLVLPSHFNVVVLRIIII